MTYPDFTDALIAEVRRHFGADGFIPLHRPVFEGNEKQYLCETIDSNFVSSVGQRVIDMENMVAEFTGSAHAVAVVNGTAALQVAMRCVGVEAGDEVLTQALTFIATANAIGYLGAKPVFIDVDEDTMGLSPDALRRWLESHAEQRGGKAYNRETGACLRACVPMHTFGLPLRIQEVADICEEWGIALVEDAAESLGSWVGDTHTGRFGRCATLSFNGNKVITTGGGGMIITDDEELAKHAKHLTTTAKVPHPFEFVHDEAGYNFRMPNLNAALGCAQMEALPRMLEIKAEVTNAYADWCEAHHVHLVKPIENRIANNWLNAIRLEDVGNRDGFLKRTNDAGVMTRPIWRLMNTLTMYESCAHDGLATSRWLEERIVNIPSAVPDGAMSG